MVKPGDGYEDIPDGGLILESGNAKRYETGGWRTQRPIIDFDTCINCFRCWAFCPDSSIETEDEEITGVDYDHCKECGVCANECPVDAISMEEE